LLLQGEGEEEETDELVSQVLDEIGINTSSQVGTAVRGEGVLWSDWQVSRCPDHSS
jgi:hypothetical protein